MLNRANALKIYGEPGRQSPHTYKRYVDQGLDDETIQFYQSTISSIWGSNDFKEQSSAKAQSTDVEIDKQGLISPVAIKVIIKQTAKHFELPINKITTTKRGQGRKNVPRWMAMKLCQDIGSAKLAEIAEAFNVGHYSTVSQSIRRLNFLMDEDNSVLAEFNVLSQDLTP